VFYVCLYTAIITTPPSDVTVCTGEVAVFTCVVDRNGIGITSDGVMWQQKRTDTGDISFVPRTLITHNISGDILTSTLTITDATDSNVKGTSSYRCVVPASYLMSRKANINVLTGTNTGSVATVECIILYFTHRILYSL